MPKDVLSVRGLTDSREQILNRISFCINKGGVYGIVGEEETTQCLVDILAGLKKPLFGDIEVDGERVKINNIKGACDKGIGIIFSGNQLMPNLTVGENVFFSSMGFTIGRSRSHTSVEAMVKSLELDINVYTKVSKLKEEEKFLVDLLRVLYRKPKIVIIMKMRGLTSKTLNILRRIVAQQSRIKISFLFLSSRIDEILSIVDNVATIHHGELSKFISIEEVKQKPSDLVKLIIGREVKDIQLPPNEDEIEIYKTIIKINELITTEHELSEIFNFLAERLIKITHGHYCNIVIVDEKSRSIHKGASYNLLAYEVEQEIVRRVIESGKTLYRENGSGTYNSIQNLDSNQISTITIYVPIKLKTQVIGVIQLGFDEPRRLKHELLKILSTFCYQAAMAVENSRLVSKSTLIMEAHHRIKNNLQSIVSLLLLESGSKKNKELDTIIEATVSRIKAMATVHELLSHRDNVSGMVNLHELIVFLLDNMPEQPRERGIHIRLDLKNYYIQYSKATSCILAINELVVNCIKHAFPPDYNGREKVIKISMQESKDGMAVKISDNGVGFKKDIVKLQSTSLGMKIIDSLIRKDMRGQFDIENIVDEKGVSGTVATILLDKQY